MFVQLQGDVSFWVIRLIYMLIHFVIFPFMMWGFHSITHKLTEGNTMDIFSFPVWIEEDYILPWFSPLPHKNYNNLLCQDIKS